ncbi:MAG: hypothetical protein ACT4QF_23320 [Sporichthyaceae bacterium]
MKIKQLIRRTGTTGEYSKGFVGRASSDDHFAGETGAERRLAHMLATAG